MKKVSFFVSLFSIVASLHAQDTTYNWTGTGGFTAAITLDSPSSTSGGLSDIVSIYVLDPYDPIFGTSFGPFANYPVTLNVPGYGPLTLSALEFDSSTVTLGSPFTWNANQITSMSLLWQPGGNILSLDAGATFGDSVGYTNYDAGDLQFDDTGIFQGPGGSVPDAASTSLLVLIALAGLGGLSAAQPKLAGAKSRKSSGKRHS